MYPRDEIPGFLYTLSSSQRHAGKWLLVEAILSIPDRFEGTGSNLLPIISWCMESGAVIAQAMSACTDDSTVWLCQVDSLTRCFIDTCRELAKHQAPKLCSPILLVFSFHWSKWKYRKPTIDLRWGVNLAMGRTYLKERHCPQIW